MRRPLLLTTALSAILLASPAFSQSRDAVSEMQRERGSPAVPAVPLQNRNAAMADEMAGNQPTQWFKEAQEALRRNRPGQAVEMLERAETRLLSRSRLADRADEPIQGPILRHSAAARAAIMQRDRQTAMREIDMAMQVATRMRGDGMRGDAMTGAGDAGMRPMQGGGMPHSMSEPPMGRPGMGHPAMGQPGLGHTGMPSSGSTMMRDQGMGGSSVARADLIILAQGGGGGGGGSEQGSGGLSGSTPGSPGTGMGGSTPRSTPGTVTTPGQGAAVPNTVQGAGRGAPPPGSATPMPGNTGDNTGGRIGAPGSTPSGGGTSGGNR